MPEAQARDAADAIFALEKRLAEASLDSATAGDPAATDHKMTFARLKELAPHFDWDAYFDEASLSRADLNVAEPKFLQQAGQGVERNSGRNLEGVLEVAIAQLRFAMALANHSSRSRSTSTTSISVKPRR